MPSWKAAPDQDRSGTLIDVDFKSTSGDTLPHEGKTMSFGKRIKELRTQRGMTQRQLAELTHVDFTYLSKIENDRLEHTPSIKTLQDLARALKVDELELMQLANKLPAAFNALVRDKDARRFFRRATATIKGPEGWRDLLNYLERKQSR